jgi:hypothetical protein
MAMKDKIIQTLAYPRLLVRGSMSLEDCEHNGNYAGGDSRCDDCEFALECRWLCNADEFAALERKPMEDVLDALDFAVDYVRAQTACAGHDSLTCRCNSCEWLRASELLLDEAAEQQNE